MGLNSSIEGEGRGFGAGERGAEHVSTVNSLSAAARVEWWIDVNQINAAIWKPPQLIQIVPTVHDLGIDQG